NRGNRSAAALLAVRFDVVGPEVLVVADEDALAEEDGQRPGRPVDELVVSGRLVRPGAGPGHEKPGPLGQEQPGAPGGDDSRIAEAIRQVGFPEGRAGLRVKAEEGAAAAHGRPEEQVAVEGRRAHVWSGTVALPHVLRHKALLALLQANGSQPILVVRE